MKLVARADYDAVDEVLRITGPDYFLQINMPASELVALRRVQTASWDQRTTITAGRALDRPVHWCHSSVDSAAVSVLVGADDETWDLALEFPAAALLSALPGP